jgi:hypothetical protein
LWSLMHLKNILDRLQQHTKFQVNWSNTCNFTRSTFMFFTQQETKFWDEPGAGQVSVGPMVPWTKMMLFNGRLKVDWWTLKEMGKQCEVASTLHQRVSLWKFPTLCQTNTFTHRSSNFTLSSSFKQNSRSFLIFF